MDYSKFDDMMDLKGLLEDIEAAESNSGSSEYKEVPHGCYEVKVEKMELVETGPKSKKPGMPMVSIWFKIIAGEYKGSLIFYNKVIMGTSNDGFMIHSNNEFLRSLQSGLDIKFENYSKYAQMLMDVHEAVDSKLEYVLDYGQNKQGFNTYEITEVFEVE